MIFFDCESYSVSNSEDLTDDLILDLIKEDSRQFDKLPQFFNHVETQIDLEDSERQALEKEREAKKEDKTPKVTISSIHRSKGKEWDHVFVFDLHDPEKVRKATSEKKIGSSKVEERRVFYVGMTRARLNLFVTGRKKDLSIFAEEAFLWPKLIKEKNPIGALEDRISKFESELSDLEMEKSRLENMGDEFKNEVENKRRKFERMIEEKDQDLEKAFKIKTATKRFADILEGSNMLIASPPIINDYVKSLPYGKFVEPSTMRNDLAKKYKAD